MIKNGLFFTLLLTKIVPIVTFYKLYTLPVFRKRTCAKTVRNQRTAFFSCNIEGTDSKCFLLRWKWIILNRYWTKAKSKVKNKIAIPTAHIFSKIKTCRWKVHIISSWHMMFRFTSKLYQFNLSGRDKLVLELMTFKNIRKHDLLKYRTYW